MFTVRAKLNFKPICAKEYFLRKNKLLYVEDIYKPDYSFV
jgi:hypothetical protein